MQTGRIILVTGRYEKTCIAEIFYRFGNAWVVNMRIQEMNGITRKTNAGLTPENDNSLP